MSFAKLDRPMIVAQAVALLKEEGLDAVSLRRVAASLGVSVSSLYWHVRDKQALYAHMSVSIFSACLDAVPSAESWEKWLHDFGMALWDAQISVPDARRLIALTRSQEDLHRPALERILATLQALGLPAAEAEVAQQSVQALVTGWTTLRSIRPEKVDSDRARFVMALDILIEGWRAHRTVD